MTEQVPSDELTCLCRAHPKHGFWLDINCPQHGNRYKDGPLFNFPTRRETEKVMDAVSEYARAEVDLKKMLSKTIGAACGITALNDRELMERLKEVWIDGYRTAKESMERKP